MGGTLWGCAAHAQLGRTCCQISEILVTEGDRVRIRAELLDHPIEGVDPDGFWHDTWPASDVYCDDGSDPGWTMAFHIDGSRPTTKRKDNGDCVFLGPVGCRLSAESRPLICRMYPYAFDEHGITGLDDDRCPREVIPPGKSIVEVLEMEESQAERWRRQLYAEIRANPGRGR
jgi:uncharacterized protein